MNKTKTSTTIAAVLLSVLGVSAQVDSTNYNDHVVRDRDRVRYNDRVDDLLFQPNELQFDLFGTGSVGQETVNHLSGDRVKDNGRLGAGAGISYFFTRYLGLGADAYTENTQHSFVDNASGNVIVRFPIEPAHLAPYVFGGAGRQFDPSEKWFGQVGGGLELRFMKNFGIFVDARYMFIDEVKDVGLGRAGLRFRF